MSDRERVGGGRGGRYVPLHYKVDGFVPARLSTFETPVSLEAKMD